MTTNEKFDGFAAPPRGFLSSLGMGGSQVFAPRSIKPKKIKARQRVNKLFTMVSLQLITAAFGLPSLKR